MVDIILCIDLQVLQKLSGHTESNKVVGTRIARALAKVNTS